MVEVVRPYGGVVLQLHRNDDFKERHSDNENAGGSREIIPLMQVQTNM